MRNEFTAIVERDGPWYIAYCAEVPGANGQGKTHEDCLESLRWVVGLMWHHSRDLSLASLPPYTRHDRVVVELSARRCSAISAGTAASSGERARNTPSGRTRRPATRRQFQTRPVERASRPFGELLDFRMGVPERGTPITGFPDAGLSPAQTAIRRIGLALGVPRRTPFW